MKYMSIKPALALTHFDFISALRNGFLPWLSCRTYCHLTVWARNCFTPLSGIFHWHFDSNRKKCPDVKFVFYSVTDGRTNPNYSIIYVYFHIAGSGSWWEWGLKLSLRKYLNDTFLHLSLLPNVYFWWTYIHRTRHMANVACDHLSIFLTIKPTYNLNYINIREMTLDMLQSNNYPSKPSQLPSYFQLSTQPLKP